MQFAYPPALWALPAALAPVILHLLGRVRRRRIIFPGTFLLQRLEAHRRALRLRELLLLALRCAAIAFAVLACAAPTLRAPIPGLPSRGELAVLVDDTASCQLLPPDNRPAAIAARWLPALGNVSLWLPGAPPAPARSAPGLLRRGTGLVSTNLAHAAPAGAPAIIFTDGDAADILPAAWPPRPMPQPAAICLTPPPPSPRAFDCRPYPASASGRGLAVLRCEGPGRLVIESAGRALAEADAAPACRAAIDWSKAAQSLRILPSGAQFRLSRAGPLRLAVHAGQSKPILRAAAIAAGCKPVPPGQSPWLLAASDAPPPPLASARGIILFLAPSGAQQWLDALAQAGLTGIRIRRAQTPTARPVPASSLPGPLGSDLSLLAPLWPSVEVKLGASVTLGPGWITLASAAGRPFAAVRFAPRCTAWLVAAAPSGDLARSPLLPVLVAAALRSFGDASLHPAERPSQLALRRAGEAALRKAWPNSLVCRSPDDLRRFAACAARGADATPIAAALAVLLLLAEMAVAHKIAPVRPTM